MLILISLFVLLVCTAASGLQFQNLNFGSGGIGADVLATVIQASNHGNPSNAASTQDIVQHQLPTETTEGDPLNNLLNFPSRDNAMVRRKLQLLEGVSSAVNELFDRTIGSRREGIVGEVFSQLKTRAVEKIFNLKFLLQVVDRLVTERNQMERMSELFNSLAIKRVNESEILVQQIHRNALELGESIRTDLARVVDTVDGGSIFSIFSGSPLFSGLSEKMDVIKRFKLKARSAPRNFDPNVNRLFMDEEDDKGSDQ
jgi:hypothetical protein